MLLPNGYIKQLILGSRTNSIERLLGLRKIYIIDKVEKGRQFITLKGYKKAQIVSALID